VEASVAILLEDVAFDSIIVSPVLFRRHSVHSHRKRSAINGCCRAADVLHSEWPMASLFRRRRVSFRRFICAVVDLRDEAAIADAAQMQGGPIQSEPLPN